MGSAIVSQIDRSRLWCCSFPGKTDLEFLGLDPRTLGPTTLSRTLRILFAAVPVIQNDDADCFRLILDSCLKLHAGSNFSHLLLGVSEHDPLLPILKRYSAMVYRTRFCYVQWDPQDSLHQRLDDRPPYLEVGCL